MKINPKRAAFAIVLILALGMAVLAVPAAAASVKIGISLPSITLQRWAQDGSIMKTAFINAGYTVDLEYADSDISAGGDVVNQINQIKNMIANDCNVLIIAAVDGTSLTDVLADAKAKNIPVIAYGRLIMNTDAVSYYVTFDNTKVGILQGQYIVDRLNLADSSVTGPFNIEFFTGDPGDSSINFFYGGAMSILQPYLDSGKLKCLSGQTDINVVATLNWDFAYSQARMEDLISAENYGPGKTKLDAVMCSNDSTAQGVTTALVSAGYTKDNFPIITGQDCDIVSVKNMLAGLQSMSVFKDTRTLADQTVTMAEAIINQKTVPINDTTTYNNGTIYVRSYLCDPIVCTVDNYINVLIDSGYYLKSDFDSTPYQLGDVNGDGRIDTSDARMVLQFIVGKTTLQNEAVTAADVNRDGKIDTVDARLILQLIVHKITSF